MDNNKPSRIGTIFYITLFILAILFVFYLVIHAMNSVKNGNRLKKEGVCIIVTVTEVLTHNGKGGESCRVKYLVGDSIVHSTVGYGSRRLKYNEQYWAKFLPDKPYSVTLLRDENKYLIPVDNPLKTPSICNCKSEPPIIIGK